MRAFDNTRKRVLAGFYKVMEASTRRDEQVGLYNGICHPPEPLSPQRLEDAERRKKEAKAAEAAKAALIRRRRS